MKSIINSYKGEFMGRKNNGFHTLARAIVGQQISVKAADSVWNKLDKLVKGKMEPKVVAKLSDEKLRSAGLSAQKANYLRNVAEFFVSEMNGTIDLIKHDHLELAEKLINIKGVGNWTVEMFMMFHMHSPDIFPIGDLGVVNAVKRHYHSHFIIPAPAGTQPKKNTKDKNSVKNAPLDSNLRQNDKEQKKQTIQKIMEISETWKPYRTVATWYLWRSLDPAPVEY